MRLHLPKRLLHAVLTALVTTPAALLGLGSTAYAGMGTSGNDANTFYLNGTEADVQGDNGSYCEWESGSVYTSITTNPEGVSSGINKIAAGEISTATINTLNLPNAKGLTISAGATNGFNVGNGLIIKDVKIDGDNGTATMTIGDSQIVTLGSVSQGTLNVEFSGTENNFNRKLQIKNSPTIALGTITNSWGLDAIDIAAGSKLTAGTISFASGNNGSGDGQGGKITGSGSVKVTTFEAGNVGNYTVSVDEFTAETINAGCASDRTLTLASNEITIGTLNLTSGAVVLTSTAEISSISKIKLQNGSFINNGTLKLNESSNIVLHDSYLKAHAAGILDESSVNGYGKFSSVAVSEIFSGSGTVEGGANAVWKDSADNTLTYNNGSITLQSELTSTIYQIYDALQPFDFSNATSLIIHQDAGTVTLSTQMPEGLSSVTISKGSTLDLNSKKDRAFRVILNGGTLANGGTEDIGTTSKQVSGITLTANSEVSAVNRMHGILDADYSPSTLSLGEYTLEKTGTGTFFVHNTTITGTGTVRIAAGTFKGNGDWSRLGDGVRIELAETTTGSGTVRGTLAGKFTNEGTSTIHAATNGTVSATITNNGTLKVTGDEGKTVTFSGAINGGNVETSATTSIATLTGEGKLKTTAKTTTVTDASGFTGTLEATGGQMNVDLTDQGSAKKLVGLTADGGGINVTNAASLTVVDMVISNGATVGVYSGADTSEKGKLNVCGSYTDKCSLTIGSRATLNANLVVNRAILDFSGNALAMGSTLTLIADGTSELRGISALSAGQSLTLFTGVVGFSTGWFDTASADVVTVDAHEIFGDLTAGTYSLKYTGAAAGGKGGDVLLIANNPTPEPTTATLSLLALMGLAARRRRRKA